MQRNVAAIADRKFDVLIIGGGIHGAAAARECAGRGMRVLLAEQADFGHATSANSLKIMHGGLRYLQHLNIKRMRDSILSRREMMRLAPEYVAPLPCIIPNVGHGIRGNFFMRLALLLNDLVGWDRNDGVPADSRLPSGRVLPQSECRRLLPDIPVQDLQGASLWYDGLAVNSERLTLAFVQAAAEQGAQCLNYVAVRQLLVEGGRISGARLFDALAGQEYAVRADTVVNGAGPWINKVLEESGTVKDPPPDTWAKAVNIIVGKRFFGPYAVGLEGERHYRDRDAVVSKKGRFFFFVPWRSYTMIGTMYVPYTGDPGNVRPEVDDVDTFIAEVNAIYPPAELVRRDVTNVHVGLVPMAAVMDSASAEVQLLKESECIDHGKKDPGLPGLFTIRGVKYTTAPRVGSSTADALQKYLGGADRQDAETGGYFAGRHHPAEGVDTPVPPDFSYLDNRYGRHASTVYRYVQKDGPWISRKPRMHAGEIDYLLDREMVCTVADVVFRRTELATGECPKREVLERIAGHMGDALGWDTERRQKEVAGILDHFASFQASEQLPAGSGAEPGSKEMK